MDFIPFFYFCKKHRIFSHTYKDLKCECTKNYKGYFLPGDIRHIPVTKLLLLLPEKKEDIKKELMLINL